MLILLLSFQRRDTLLRHQDRVDDVDNAIRAFNIGFLYHGIVHLYLVAQPVLLDRERTTLKGGHIFQFAEVSGHELLRDDVIGQDGPRLARVFKRADDRTSRKFGERLVLRGKQSDRISTLDVTANPVPIIAL